VNEAAVTWVCEDGTEVDGFVVVGLRLGLSEHPDASNAKTIVATSRGFKAP
jgi:hypothetical protein